MKSNPNPLQDYKQKRDFAITPEPINAFSEKESGWSFVVQKHNARSTHYDFRLEFDGVLKSWAVPKGPSLDPAQKRLAVHVEDHPLEYAGFEGLIPPGQYGAGSVIVWDSGVWEPITDPREGLDTGNLKFRLHGQKLQGSWALVKMHDKSNKNKDLWLLIKERDSFALSISEFNLLEALPDSVLKSTGTLVMPTGAKLGDMPYALAPQLATLVDHAPENDDWSYEIKFDGYRILARIEQGEVNLYTRNGLDWTDKLKNLAAELKALDLASGWLDGEIVVLGENGTPDFGALQKAFESKFTDEVSYFVFDIPFYAGFDLRNTPLAERRTLLASILSESPSGQISFSEDFGAKGVNILKSACGIGLEGLIGKRKDSPYISGRSQNWIKLKCSERQEFVVVGFTESKSADRGIGAILVGYYDEKGRLKYAGRVGTGFNQKTASSLREKLLKLSTEQAPLFEKPEEAKGNWVLPELVVEVSFAGWTKDGILRHAVFQGLRDDKPPGQITRENAKESAPVEVSGTQISNADRVIDPSTGLTKLDLINYYMLASKWMLPHLEDRPVAFLRAPSGLKGQLFFQKHRDTLSIPELKDFDSRFDPKHAPLLEIDTHLALTGAVQMNVIKFHTCNLTSKNLDKPDRIVFDLDPGEGLTWPMLLEAADMTRTLLEELGLQCFLKTSGGKGLHVVVPLTPKDDWKTVKEFSKGVSGHLSKVLPNRFTAISGPQNRFGKVFIDYMRNNHSATTVSAFSARARPGMGVSMPCSWQELYALKSGAHWTIITAVERLKSCEDPWKEYPRIRQTLSESSKEKMLTPDIGSKSPKT